MHSGFNGQATGCTLIVLTTLIIKSKVVLNATNDIVAIGAVAGALFALWWFNFYPSRIIEGNNGALMIGAAIGITIVIKGFLIAGFIMLIPHTINFLLYVYWRIQRLRFPDDPGYKAIKFGKLRKDGTLKVPNRMTLKWVFPYYFRMTEKQAVLALYALTLVFCVIGFMVPGEGALYSS
jgi:UDP-N-acetylglucosamine--dolichyl-phosphate N-acetylglucosaminephosphotransferase